jgi:hypothetical protein
LPVTTLLPLETELGSAVVVARKKPSRRQSGLLSATASGSMRIDGKYPSMVPLQRPPSPAFGSPIRRDVNLDDDGEVILMNEPVDMECDDLEGDAGVASEMVTRREKRKGKGKEIEAEKERDMLIDVPRPRERERKRAREEDEIINATVEGLKLKLKDVTNSPRSRSALPPVDANAAGACFCAVTDVLPACAVP